MNKRKLADIPRIIRATHFNCVRLVYSLDVIFDAVDIEDPPTTLAANPEFWKNRTEKHPVIKPYDLLKLVVRELSNNEVMVILNNHVSSGGWCCSNSDGEGLWYTDAYSEAAW